MTILYDVQDKLYLNITNKCPCNCIFCIRNNGESVYGSDSLWLEEEPTNQMIIDELSKTDLSKYTEVVFCGYGEPLERLDTVVEVSKFIKSISSIPIRINTNGLADLIHKKDTVPLLKGLIDIVSISLNAGSEEEYIRVSQPCFGKGSFDAMLKFSTEIKKYVDKVVFSVVDIISKEEIEKCKELSQRLGIPLRIRAYEK